ncbi:helix-turn-helix transcriptional regulator [Halovivax cerinus]|uniref:Helix-turn-helix transcriptional regulator n=1 Tax=Halovivax cerinus TaxID=1487865 RepID=A0ABD5NM22_9EURY|nr:winged helix-turn-helix domain-containing protein [Halovivax cerinus]
MNDSPVGMLVGSPVRVQLLAELVESAQTVTELDAEIDATRRTVRRNLSQLETEGWIRRSEQTYSVVPVAESFISELLEYHERAARLHELVCALEHIPTDRVDVPSDVLVDCESVVRHPSDPAGPQDEVLSAVRSASTVLTFVPTVTKQLVDAHETALGVENQVEIIVGSTGLECIRSSDVIDPSSAFLGSLYVYEHPMEPVGIVRTDDRTLLLSYDGYGTLHALVSGFHPQFQSWGSGFYETVRKNSAAVDRTDV